MSFRPKSDAAGAQAVELNIVVSWVILKGNKKLYATVFVNRVIRLAVPGQYMLLCDIVFQKQAVAAVCHHKLNFRFFLRCSPGSIADQLRRQFIQFTVDKQERTVFLNMGQEGEF